MATSRHCIRVFIKSGYVDLQAECMSSTDAECQVNINEGIIAGSVCRYVQWWAENEVSLEEFYAGEDEVLRDGAEIEISWGDDAWEWELKK